MFIPQLELIIAVLILQGILSPLIFKTVVLIFDYYLLYHEFLINIRVQTFQALKYTYL